MSEELTRLAAWRERVSAFLAGLTEKDLGVVKVKTKTGKVFEMGPCLFKPGSESVAVGFGLRFREPDITITPSGGFLIKVALEGPDSLTWGVGYGDAGMDGDGNTALKLAFKRARVDAALSFLAASDRLTQDLDDHAYRRKLAAAQDRPAAPGAPPARAPGETHTPTAETGTLWPFTLKTKGKADQPPNTVDVAYVPTRTLEWYIQEYEPSKRDSKYAGKNAELAVVCRSVLGTRAAKRQENAPAAAARRSAEFDAKQEEEAKRRAVDAAADREADAAHEDLNLDDIPF